MRWSDCRSWHSRLLTGTKRMVGRLAASKIACASVASFLEPRTNGSHEEPSIKQRFSGCHPQVSSGLSAASQVRARLHHAPSPERAEAHMRSPWATAAPSSRILRAGLRKTGPFLTPAAEAIPYVGPSTWIRQGRSGLGGTPHPGISVASGGLHRGAL